MKIRLFKLKNVIYFILLNIFINNINHIIYK